MVLLRRDGIYPDVPSKLADWPQFGQTVSQTIVCHPFSTILLRIAEHCDNSMG